MEPDCGGEGGPEDDPRVALSAPFTQNVSALSMVPDSVPLTCEAG